MQWLAFGVRLVLINLLFGAGTLVGLGLFGLFPAGAAASVLLSRLLAGAEGDRIIRDFIGVYRRQFFHLNRVGSIFWLAGVLAAVNLIAFGAPEVSPLAGESVPGAVLFLLFALVSVLISAAAFNAVAICARYRDTVLRTWRLAFVLPLASPATGLGIVITLVASGALFTVIPALVPLVGASLPLLLTGWFINRRLAELRVVPLPASKPAQVPV